MENVTWVSLIGRNPYLIIIIVRMQIPKSDVFQTFLSAVKRWDSIRLQIKDGFTGDL